MFKPKMDLTWPEAMVIAAADVNPAVTGTDIKSITNPVNKELESRYLF